jgi:hypothetical protein
MVGIMDEHFTKKYDKTIKDILAILDRDIGLSDVGMILSFMATMNVTLSLGYVKGGEMRSDMAYMADYIGRRSAKEIIDNTLTEPIIPTLHVSRRDRTESTMRFIASIIEESEKEIERKRAMGKESGKGKFYSSWDNRK